MRLTLRTLLAYLDDILEPEDAEKLRQKIEENPNASDLTHRIRACMAKSRLSSPAVHGRGLAADANTVSEYLDNTLAVERMPEFERTCLESDVHLSEVASCHQILTMVLGEPVEVDNSLRKMAYGLNATAGTSDLGTFATDGTSATVKSPSSTASTASHASSTASVSTGANTSGTETSGETIPYYDAADSPRSWVWPVALMLIAGFLIATAVLNGMQWLRGTTEVANNTNTGNIDVAASPPQVDSAASLERPAITPNNPSDLGAAPVIVPPVIDEPSITDSTELTPLVPLTELPSIDKPVGIASAPADIGSMPADMAAAATDTAPVDIAAAPVTPVDPKPASVISPPPLIPSTPITEADDPPATVTPPVTPPAQPMPEHLADNGARRAVDSVVGGGGADIQFDGDDDPKPEKPAVPRDVARSVVEDQAMAIWNGEKQTWTRLNQREPLRVGQRFRNLPTFRPQLLLVGGLQMTLDGNCEFSLGEPSGVDTPRVKLAHGRVLFTGLGQAPSRIELDVNGRIITIQQGDQSDDFAVEVIRTRTPGSNPETAARHHVVKIWPRSGRIGISEGEEEDRESKAVEAAQMWVAIDGRAAVAGETGDLPAWVSGPKMRDIDRTALLELEPLLTQDRSLTLSLLEASKHRRTDVRSLAARCLAALGRYEPIIESLGDRKQHAHWSQHVAQLRSAVDQHPDSSALVAQSLRRVTGPDADGLMRLLASYSPLQLADGGAEHLIDTLEDESLEVRVIAIETLKDITGMSQLYRPDRPAAQRQVAVQKWRGRLAEGEVLYAEQPLIFPGDADDVHFDEKDRAEPPGSSSTPIVEPKRARSTFAIPR